MITILLFDKTQPDSLRRSLYDGWWGSDHPGMCMTGSLLVQGMHIRRLENDYVFCAVLAGRIRHRARKQVGLLSSRWRACRLRKQSLRVLRILYLIKHSLRRIPFYSGEGGKGHSWLYSVSLNTICVRIGSAYIVGESSLDRVGVFLHSSSIWKWWVIHHRKVWEYDKCIHCTVHSGVDLFIF